MKFIIRCFILNNGSLERQGAQLLVLVQDAHVIQQIKVKAQLTTVNFTV